MSEDVYTAHKCSCEVPTIGLVDGDTEIVYCSVCDGAIGGTDEVTLETLSDGCEC